MFFFFCFWSPFEFISDYIVGYGVNSILIGMPWWMQQQQQPFSSFHGCRCSLEYWITSSVWYTVSIIHCQGWQRPQERKNFNGSKITWHYLEFGQQFNDCDFFTFSHYQCHPFLVSDFNVIFHQIYLLEEISSFGQSLLR